MKSKFVWLLYAALAVVCLASLRSVSAQQPATLAAELAPPVYSTLTQSGGLNWIAYGYLYPPGTFDERQPCAPMEDVAPIGSYQLRGAFGNAGFHAATYRVTFGKPSDGKQFVFAGIVEFATDDAGQVLSATYPAARLSVGRLVDELEIEFTPRSPDCFGGAVRVLAIPASLRIRN